MAEAVLSSGYTRISLNIFYETCIRAAEGEELLYSKGDLPRSEVKTPFPALLARELSRSGLTLGESAMLRLARPVYGWGFNRRCF
jgi:hypothetical protein